MSNFKIKASPRYSEKYLVFIKYTTNGIFWKTIKECYYDYSKDSYYLSSKKIHVYSVDGFLQQFKTLEDILEFQKKEKEKCDQKNELRKKNKIKQFVKRLLKL